MRLSAFSDYSLRVLMFLGVNPGRLATIAEIAKAYGISENHLMKVVHQLGRAGYIETVRGKGGGMRLARAPTEILIGDVVRQSENDLCLVECLGKGISCRIASACLLKSIMSEALEAMFLVLNAYSLADIIAEPGALTQFLQPVRGEATAAS